MKIAMIPSMLLVGILLTWAAQTTDLSVPDEVSRRFRQENLWARFEICDRVNPFYLRADLDGDGKPDFVVLVRTVDEHTEYLALVLSSRKLIKLYPRNKGPKFDGWVVLPRGQVVQGTSSRTLKREAFVLKFGGPGIVEYWNGKDLASLPWGD